MDIFLSYLVALLVAILAAAAIVAALRFMYKLSVSGADRDFFWPWLRTPAGPRALSAALAVEGLCFLILDLPPIYSSATTAPGGGVIFFAGLFVMLPSAVITAFKGWRVSRDSKNYSQFEKENVRVLQGASAFAATALLVLSVKVLFLLYANLPSPQ
jgi:hypothetical protein